MPSARIKFNQNGIGSQVRDIVSHFGPPLSQFHMKSLLSSFTAAIAARNSTIFSKIF